MLTILLVLSICTCVTVLLGCLAKREPPLGRFEPEPETPPARRRSRWQQTYRHFRISEGLTFSPVYADSPKSSESSISPDMLAEHGKEVLRQEEEDTAALELYLALVSTSDDSDTDSSALMMAGPALRRPSRWQENYRYFRSNEETSMSPDGSLV